MVDNYASTKNFYDQAVSDGEPYSSLHLADVDTDQKWVYGRQILFIGETEVWCSLTSNAAILSRPGRTLAVGASHGSLTDYIDYQMPYSRLRSKFVTIFNVMLKNKAKLA